MTNRISDEDFENIRGVMAFAFEQGFHELGYDPVLKLELELQQSRALISQLRELAERMRKYDPIPNTFRNGRVLATEYWLEQLDSLLSAHGAQGEKQADAEGQ